MRPPGEEPRSVDDVRLTAQQRFEEAIRVDPHSAVAFNNLGSVLAMRGRIAEAERAFRRAVEIDPGYADARRNLEQARRILAGGG